MANERITWRAHTKRERDYYLLRIQLNPGLHYQEITITAQANAYEDKPQWYAWRAHIEVQDTANLAPVCATLRRFLGRGGNLTLGHVKRGMMRGQHVEYDARVLEFVPVEDIAPEHYARYCDKLPYPNVCTVAANAEDAKRALMVQCAERGNTKMLEKLLNTTPERDYNVSAPCVQSMEELLEPWNR